MGQLADVEPLPTLNRASVEPLPMTDCSKNSARLSCSSSRFQLQVAWSLQECATCRLPAKDYCILACEQWNSPLYCSDTQHAQVLFVIPSLSLLISTCQWPSATAAMCTCSRGCRCMPGRRPAHRGYTRRATCMTRSCRHTEASMEARRNPTELCVLWPPVAGPWTPPIALAEPCPFAITLTILIQSRPSC